MTQHRSSAHDLVHDGIQFSKKRKKKLSARSSKKLSINTRILLVLWLPPLHMSSIVGCRGKICLADRPPVNLKQYFQSGICILGNKRNDH